MKTATLLSGDRQMALRILALVAPAGTSAELGVYQGGSLRIIAEARPLQPALGFDTFTGLPGGGFASGELHQAGEFAGTSFEKASAALAGLPNVRLIQGLFPESFTEEARFGFVHLDADFYLSTKLALEYFWPRMVPDGIIVLDDYEWRNCPGVKRALVEFGKKIYPSAPFQAFLIKR